MSNTTNKPKEAVQEPVEDLDAFGIPQDQKVKPLPHTVLEAWRTIFDSVLNEKDQHVSLDLAFRILRTWPLFKTTDIRPYLERYYEILQNLGLHLEDIILENPGCLEYLGEVGAQDSDAVANHDLYIEAIYRWSFELMKLELKWLPELDDAAIEMAVIADVAAFSTGPEGLIQHLGSPQVGFRWSQVEQDGLQKRLDKAREELQKRLDEAQEEL
jgi:hypothetical protein